MYILVYVCVLETAGIRVNLRYKLMHCVIKQEIFHPAGVNCYQLVKSPHPGSAELGSHISDALPALSPNVHLPPRRDLD